MICNRFSIVNNRKDGNTGMVYLLDIKNRLAAKTKSTSIASNQQSAISNQQSILHYFHSPIVSCWLMRSDASMFIGRHLTLPTNSSCLLSKERL